MAKKSKIPASIRNYVMQSFDCCAACGTWDSKDCGHLVAESNGGAMVAENFVRLCNHCNGVQANANVVFGTFAPYTIEPALIISRRAYWTKYCKSARGSHKIKPYQPK